MLIKFFKSSFIIQYFVLVLITVAMWMPGFLKLQEIPAGTSLTTPLYNLAHYLMAILQPYNPIIAYIIILISGLTLNNILVYHELIPKNNILPAFIFILFMGISPFSLNLYPVLITIPLFTWFLHTIYTINDEPENSLAVFNASMILAVITMIYLPAALLFLYLWLVLLVFGTFTGRNIIITLIGFFLPYIYLAFYYFWTDHLAAAWQAYLEVAGGLFRIAVATDYFQFAIWAVFILLMLIPAFFKITGTLSSYNINFRKKMAATNWFLVMAAPMIITGGRVELNLLILLPASIIVTHYFNIYKRSVFNETVLAVFVALVIAHNYLGL